jgi:aspartate kinase
VDAGPLGEALSHGVVPVVAGFQGAAPDGSVATLGRGGSDTTACALAVALEADAVEIYTDVDGVMTADPRACDGVRVLDRVTYEELFQMSRHGSKVVHMPAAELAKSAGVEMRVRNTFSEKPGTRVTAAVELPRGEGRVATAVSHLDGVARLKVSLPPDPADPSHMAGQTRVYSAMAKAGVSLDMFTPLDGRMVFSVAEEDLPPAIKALDGVGLPYEVDTGLAKVTLVGAGMHGVPGVMARMAQALFDAEVTVLQTADSHATISVLVWQNTRKSAVEALHSAFGLGE